MRSKNPFDSCSEPYDKYRPDYPAGLIAYIASLAGKSLMIDVGAGTGKASAPFAARGLPVVSVEPSPAMSRQGMRSYPNLRYVLAAAESLPLASRSADTVICAQAFHWFDAAAALAEFARVLQPGGSVCLFWNTRDGSAAAAKLFDDLIHKWNPDHDPRYRQRNWSEQIAASGLFQAIEQRTFFATTPMTVEDWIGLSRSISYVSSMGAERIPHFETELRSGLLALDAIACPYISELWTAKLSSSSSR